MYVKGGVIACMNSARSRDRYNNCKLDKAFIWSEMRTSHWVRSRHSFVCRWVHVCTDVIIDEMEEDDDDG